MIYIQRMRMFGKALRVIMQQRQALEALQEENVLLYQKMAVASVYEAAIPMLQRAVVEEQRKLLDTLSAWRVSLEQPEVDIRAELDADIRLLADQIAVNEEQVV